MTARPESTTASAASNILRGLRIQHADEIDVELIAATCGVSVVFSPLAKEEGHLLRAGSIGLINVSESARRTNKWRFIIGHELGHFLRHPKLDQFKLCTNSELTDWYNTSGNEAEANQFSAELLMPEWLFKPLCDVNRPSLRDVQKLAEGFRTTLTATSIRFVKFCPEPCCVVYSTSGTVDWAIRSAGFPLFIPRGMRLNRGTYAGDLHAGEPVEDRPQLIDGFGWANGRDIDLQEHSIKLGAYDSVLTMLWHKWK